MPGDALRPYPLKGDDNASWWRGRCRTCAWFGERGECWKGGVLVVRDAQGREHNRPLLYAFPAARMRCWTETRDAR